MTYEEYEDGIDILKDIFNPRGWTDRQDASYYRRFKFLDASTWHRMCSGCADTCTAMPRPKHLMDALSEIRDKDGFSERGHVRGTGCGKCEDGRRYFTTHRWGLEYEKYAACDCVAGDSVARQMLYFAKRMKRLIDPPEAVRYDWLAKHKEDFQPHPLFTREITHEPEYPAEPANLPF